MAVALACNPTGKTKSETQAFSQEPCDDADNAFGQKVLPIFQASCAMSGCHSSASASGGYKLDNYKNIKASIKGKEKMVLASIHFEGDSFSWMPRSNPNDPALPNDKLPEDDIRQIECWISRGMPND